MTASPSVSLMNQAIDPIWLCAMPSDLCARQLANSLGLTTIVQSTKLVVYGTGGRAIDEQSAKAAIVDYGYLQYFENAYLSKALSGQARLDVVQSYFDTVSSSYTGLTQKDVNPACYEYLFEVARAVNPNFKNCLDFGCGPGTILDSAVSKVVRDVVGWDFSPSMQRIAQNRGLTVLRDDDFWSIPRQFQLVLSVFVLHYGTVSVAVLQRISLHLEVGGVFVANFHKGIGLNDFLLTLDQVTNLVLVAPVSSSSFGQIVLLTRIV
jgi:SAM-dependent methyltransferase